MWSQKLLYSYLACPYVEGLIAVLITFSPRQDIYKPRKHKAEDGFFVRNNEAG